MTYNDAGTQELITLLMKLFSIVQTQITNLLHECINVVDGRLGTRLGVTLVYALTSQQVYATATPLACLNTVAPVLID